MNVIGDAGAGDASQVHAQIEALRLVNQTQRRLAPLSQIHHFISDIFGGLGQLTNMVIRSDHQMAADVWIPIKDYEIEVAAKKDGVLFVVRGVF